MRERTGGKLAQGLGCDKSVDKACHLSFFSVPTSSKAFFFRANNDINVYGRTTYEVVFVISNSSSLQNKILLLKQMNLHNLCCYLMGLNCL